MNSSGSEKKGSSNEENISGEEQPSAESSNIENNTEGPENR